MRLTELKYQLELSIEKLIVDSSSPNGDNYYYIYNISELNETISKLKQFGYFQSEINTLENKFTSVFYLRDDKAVLFHDKYNKYVSLINSIREKTEIVILALNNAIDNQKENIVSVKLPPYTDLSNVSKFISDIEKILRLIMPPKKPTDIKLATFDVGTNWIDVILSTMEHVQIVADFVNTMVEFVQVTILGSARTMQELKKYSNESEKELILALEKRVKHGKIEEYVNMLIEENLISVEGMNENEVLEYKSSLIKAFELYEPYVVDGAEIRPALNAPETVKESFPKEEDIKRLQHTRDQLLIDQSPDNDDNEVSQDPSDTNTPDENTLNSNNEDES